ncbi:hypothetical protein LQ564_13325 [Massilia sp. G4R7]|uniref:DUF4124 domain-containing protein n=1 Tax=Massilia phyllostachyos TaxID=2898585 RepID=A0ABS8Q6B4_9BURK|nr:hypothetical protein [Massilia phyllostachyos]MCD2517289.1 hypothetical protein [Massilia phyllostachyos]
MNKSWLALAAILVSQAQAADPRYVPTPGLYEFTSSTLRVTQSESGTSRDQRDIDANSNQDVRFQREDGRSGQYNIPGNTPARTCIQPTKSGAIPAQMLAGGCIGKPGVVKGDSMVSVANCPWGKMTLSMRRLDDRNWENIVEEERSGARGGKQDLRASTAPLMAMLRQQASTGTPAQRAEAREALAGMEQQIKEAEAALRENADIIDDDVDAGSPVRTRTVIRMKRVADTCR